MQITKVYLWKASKSFKRPLYLYNFMSSLSSEWRGLSFLTLDINILISLRQFYIFKKHLVLVCMFYWFLLSIFADFSLWSKNPALDPLGFSQSIEM